MTNLSLFLLDGFRSVEQAAKSMKEQLISYLLFVDLSQNSEQILRSVK